MALTLICGGLSGCLEPENEDPDDDGTGIACGDDALYAVPHDSCEPMDAVGQGACFCALGFAWTGSECVSLDGSCECVGDDCTGLFQNEAECIAAHESCGQEEPTGLECGDDALYSLPHDSCEPMDAAGEGACFCALGFAWNGTGCVSLDGSCECIGDDCTGLFQSEADCVAAHQDC